MLNTRIIDMTSSDSESPKISDAQILKSQEQIQEAITAIETALSIHPYITEGMALSAMSRIIGIRIRQGTLALGPEVRQKHVDGFCGIIKAHAFNEEDGDGSEEST
jgi:hypothetical protein